MKKLITIIASALTLGAFAGQNDTVVPFDTTGVAVGTTVKVMADEVVITTGATTGDTLYVQIPAEYDGKDIYLADEDGNPITVSAPYVAAVGVSAKFASIKTVGTGDAITVDSGTLDDPTVLTVADVDAASEVVIKSGCAAKVAPGGNKTWKITGEGSDSYIILDGTANYGFDEGSKFTNVTIVIDAPGRNVWLEDRATDVYGESVNLIIKQGTVTFGAGKQANPIVSFGTITKEGGTLASNGGTKVVAKTLALGQTETPEYMFEGLLWNNDNNGHWYADTTSASGTTITAEDKVVFNGCDKVLYNHCTTASKIVVSAGTLKIGHNDQGGNNLAAGSVVTIASGATAELRCWDSNPCNTYTVRFPGVTFNGPGSVVVNDYVKHISVGSLAGNAPLNIKSADIVLSESGSIAYTGAISGSGTIPSFSGMSLASDWTGTVKLPATVASGLNLNAYGNSNSKVEIAGVNGGWLAVPQGTIYINPTLVLKGEFMIDAYSPRTYAFTGIEGDATFSVVKAASANSPSAITIGTVDQAKFNGAIKAANGSTLTIATLKTSLDELPSEKTKVLTIAEGTTDTIAVTAATLADGTAIDSDKISVEADGIYVLGNAPAMPEDIAGGSEAQQTAYVAWAAEVGITDPTVTGASEAFVLKLTAAELEAAQSVEKAVEDKLDTLITDALLAELVAKAATGDTVVTIPGYENATFTFKVVSQDEIKTTAYLFRLAVSFKPEN